MMRANLITVAVLLLSVSSAHALTEEELRIARTFEGEWGIVRNSPEEFESTAGLGCGEERALTFRIEQDEYEDWRFYWHPSQQFSGDVVVSASDDGEVQRLTISAFAPIGRNTDIYERRGDRVTMRFGFDIREFKRC